MNYGIRDVDDRHELDISWDHTDVTFSFDSVEEDRTGDVIFKGTRFGTARINQADGADIGLIILEDGDLIIEGRADYTELIQDLAIQTEFHRWDEGTSG